jgi:hypothetical protein
MKLVGHIFHAMLRIGEFTFQWALSVGELLI